MPVEAVRDKRGNSLPAYADTSAFAVLGRERLRGGDSAFRFQFLPCGDGDVACFNAARRRKNQSGFAAAVAPGAASKVARKNA